MASRIIENAPGSLMVFQVVPDPAVGTLGVRDPKLVDVAVEGIGNAAHMPPDPNASWIEA